jgi:hypothetical protein
VILDSSHLNYELNCHLKLQVSYEQAISMPLLSLPTEIQYQVLQELNAESLLAISAADRHFRSLVLEKHDIQGLTIQSLIDLEKLRPCQGFHNRHEYDLLSTSGLATLA